MSRPERYFKIGIALLLSGLITFFVLIPLFMIEEGYAFIKQFAKRGVK